MLSISLFRCLKPRQANFIFLKLAPSSLLGFQLGDVLRFQLVNFGCET